MARLVSSARPKDIDSVVNISYETAVAVGLLTEAQNYEIQRQMEQMGKTAKDASGQRLLEYLESWAAEYPDRSFDLLGSDDAEGRVIRLQVRQSSGRDTLDPVALMRRLMELGVAMDVIEDAIGVATVKGAAGKPYCDVRRVKGVG